MCVMSVYTFVHVKHAEIVHIRLPIRSQTASWMRKASDRPHVRDLERLLPIISVCLHDNRGGSRNNLRVGVINEIHKLTTQR